MRDLTQEILELVRFTSTNLPPDVEKVLREAFAQEEPGSAAHSALETILKNVEMTRRNSTPICQDTGTPIFFVRYPEGYSPRALRAQIQAAVAEATKKTYLRPNAVDSLNGKNTGNNLGDQHFPTIHYPNVPFQVAVRNRRPSGSSGGQRYPGRLDRVRENPGATCGEDVKLANGGGRKNRTPIRPHKGTLVYGLRKSSGRKRACAAGFV